MTSLEQALLEALDSRFADVHTCMPGRVESYDDAKQTASVQPMLKRVDTDTDGGQAVADYPVLASVPIVWPRFGGFFIQGTLAAGDFVLLAFCEGAIDAWRARGTLTHPGDLRRHSITGAVAIPGLYPSGRALPAAAGDLIIGKEDGTEIRIKANGEVHLAGGADYVALSAKVDDFITKLDTVFRTTWVVAPMDGGAALKTAYTGAFSAPPDSVAADKVKAT
jgi:hypothetical protein